jgi:8-oxo-dGTP pyrophosphatase MutT (NUDIX family)
VKRWTSSSKIWLDVETKQPTLEQIRARLAQHQPVPHPGGAARPAAVAIVLRPDHEDVQVLFIKRAEYEQDPWSGQVAFPGGRHEPGDPDLLQTALRETREEIGVDLGSATEVIGRLDDIHSRTVKLPNVYVRPFVLALSEEVEFTLSNEVAEAFWVPMSVLRDAASWRPTTVQARGLTFEVRACEFQGRIIWGMTERITSQLLKIAFMA